MPAPCTSDWPAVKATAIARNSIKEAAELHSVSYEAAKQRASREAWPVGRRPAKAAEQAKQVAHAQLVKVSPSAVASVTSASDAIATAIAQDGRNTKLDLAKAARKAAGTLRDLPGEAIVEKAQQMRHVASTAALLHGWEEKQAGGLTLQLGIQLG